MNERSESDWETALRGMQRFFDEGMTHWSKAQFTALFPTKEIAECAYVREHLRQMNERGAIDLMGREDLFLVVKNI